MQKIYIAQHPTEAHLIKGLLESYDISCEVRGEALFGVRGEVPLTSDTLPSVWIHDDGDYEKARAVIDGYEKRNKEPVPAQHLWKCPKCGEPLEEQFTACWNCGTERRHDL